MSRWSGLFLILLAVPLLGLAQVVATPYGWATLGGPAVPIAQGGASLAAPIVSLEPVSPSPVGATNATANNVAGATNATIGNVPPVVNATQMRAFYSTPYPTVVGAGSEYQAPEVEATASAPSASSGTFNFGAAQFDSAYNVPPQPETSLGEVAREWRQKEQTERARSYTNEDITRIQAQSGGLSGTAVNTGTPTTPSNAPTGNAPAVGNPVTPPAQTTAPPPNAMAQASAPQGANAPEAETSAQTTPAQQGGMPTTLPPAASPLPTLLLLGLLAITAGLVTSRLQRARNRR